MPDVTADSLTNHVIIAGYGIVGRCVAEMLAAKKICFCIVELNPATVTRLAYGSTPIIKGDIRDKDVLKNAGIERAAALALAMPEEKDTLEALQVALSLRPELPVIARCTYSSAGMQAAKLGAVAVVVAEQVVARDFTRLVEKNLPTA